MDSRSWFNVKEAAAYLQVSRETIYSLMDRGLLPYSEVKGVRGRRIKKEDLEALLHPSIEKQKSEQKGKRK